MVQRWVFDDGTDTMTLPINPESMSGSIYSRLNINPFTNLRGRVLLTEGAPTPGEISFTGTILTESHYRLWEEWRPGGAHGRRRITITDHLNRELNGVLTSFEPIPVRSMQYPWRHTFTATFMVITVDNLGPGI